MSYISPAIIGPNMAAIPSKRFNKLKADVKFSIPRSSTRTIVLRMKKVVENPYIADTKAYNPKELHKGKKNTVAPQINI